MKIDNFKFEINYNNKVACDSTLKVFHNKKLLWTYLNVGCLSKEKFKQKVKEIKKEVEFILKGIEWDCINILDNDDDLVISVISEYYLLEAKKHKDKKCNCDPKCDDVSFRNQCK